MNHRVLLATVAALSCAGALAFTNEAVKVLPNGQRQVELPPGPKRPELRQRLYKPNPWNSLINSSFIIETDTGTMECPLHWVDDSCRPYQKGKERRARAFVVKFDGTWHLCPKRDSTAGCVGYHDLPPLNPQD
jgi:hypothetical protein